MAKFYQTLAAGGPVAGVGSDSAYFVSFVSPGLPVAERDLAFTSNPGTAEGREAAATFADLVAAIPPTRGFWRMTGARVWDVYRRVLVEAALPTSTLTANEQTRLRDATALLWTTTVELVDGVGQQVTVETALYRRYNEHARKYAEALLQYNAGLVDVRANPNDATKVAWWAVNGPRLEAKVRAAMSAWVAAGKNVVDGAFSAIDRLTARDPFVRWSDLKSRFDQYERMDGQGGLYYYTDYLPPDVVGDEAGWAPFSLTSREIEGIDLATAPLWGGSAPASYQLWRFGETAVREATATRPSEARDFTLTLEFKRVPIRRLWLSTEIFSSRAWRFPNSFDVLSDGALPPLGLLAAYPVEVILVRNLFLSMDMSQGSDQSAADKFDDAESLGWGPFRLRGSAILPELKPDRAELIERLMNKPWVDPMPDIAFERAGRVHAATLPRPVVTPITLGPLPRPGAPSPFAVGEALLNLPSRPLPTIAATEAFRASSVVNARNEPPRTNPGGPVTDEDWNTRSAERRKPHDFARTRDVIAAPGLQIIGFGCQLVPRCPNPDISLAW
jgi:hypothetical protein